MINIYIIASYDVCNNEKLMLNSIRQGFYKRNLLYIFLLLQDSSPLDVLRLFYTSLLNHTAHVYFISEQIERHSQDETCNSPGFSNNAKSLASEMRGLMCALRLCTLTLEKESDEDDSFKDSTDQILNEELTDQPLCSRRSVRDCQTVGSTVTLLRELSSYLQNTVLDS